GFDAPVEDSRRRFAQLVGVDPSWVAVGPQVSFFVGLVAASLPAGSQVLTAAEDFTSVLFPFHAQHPRGITVREVPLDDLVAAIDDDTSLVAVSAAQSADGRVADLEGLLTATADTDTRVLLDTTQSAGWLPLDASRFHYTITGGYKWLLAPRGTAFMTVQPGLVDELSPVAAGWYAGEDRWTSVYGSPLRLASDARRFDVSPAWHSWVGQAPSLELLLEVGPDRLHRHAVGLAHRFQDAVGLPRHDSAILAMDTDAEVPRLLEEAGIAAATRAGRLRLAFHVSTTTEDVDRAAEVLVGHVHA
ncbi:MAG: aminotransferase class V-fold PLP-dependent enzyme, partial [Nitriliruptoraceae bacterium]